MAWRWVQAIVVALQVALTGLVLGVPDFAAAYGLVRHGYPEQAGMLAVGEIIVWASLLGLGGATLVAALRETRARLGRGGTARRRAPWMIVVLGAVCLGVGMARHSAATYSPCCGSPQQAEKALEALP